MQSASGKRCQSIKEVEELISLSFVFLNNPDDREPSTAPPQPKLSLSQRIPPSFKYYSMVTLRQLAKQETKECESTQNNHCAYG